VSAVVAGMGHHGYMSALRYLSEKIWLRTYPIFKQSINLNSLKKIQIEPIPKINPRTEFHHTFAQVEPIDRNLLR
jgi:hypothetical protein